MSMEKILKNTDKNRYEPVELGKHPCLTRPERKFKLYDSVIPKLEDEVYTFLDQVCFTKTYTSRRHSPVIFDPKDNLISDKNIEVINSIINNNKNNKLMTEIKEIRVEKLSSCCQG